MKIAHFEIQNFRKLKSCRVELGGNETIFVGANNSGKTSAMDSLILFLVRSKNNDIKTTDFTLSNWQAINEIGDSWKAIDAADLKRTRISSSGKKERFDSIYLEAWRQLTPSVDVWLEVSDAEIHYVSHLIPTLSWRGGLLGVRLALEPNTNTDLQIEDLYKDYRQAINDAEATIAAARQKKGDETENKDKNTLKLWPSSLREFLDKELHKYFSINAYFLDPNELKNPIDGVATPQQLPINAVPLSSKQPFNGLFKVDVINAQRGFSDPNSTDQSGTGGISLSSQLREYYDKHLDPTDHPETEDIEALTAIDEAQVKFDTRLKESFKSALSELEQLGYPGFSDPRILVTAQVNPIEGISHESAVQFGLGNDKTDQQHLTLPEKYNGLGYQNLVSMVFKLIRFRDEWMRVGKARIKKTKKNSAIEPLHLVLIEEPEAHLHAQVQQVFIKNAYSILRNSKTKEHAIDEHFSTQMIVSTHSSHLAHEVNFSTLRYFRRKPAENNKEVPSATLINLSETFGDQSDTSKFAARYLKTTHCDLFFSDAVILIEGPVERMLMPHFITTHFPELNSRYLTILEIGGSHAHRLQPLIEKLGVFCLVVTDLDSMHKPNNDQAKKIQPQRGAGHITGNETLSKWYPKLKMIDDLFEFKDKVTANGLVRVAYQAPMNISYDQGKLDETIEAIPYTFEDALALTNITLFRDLTKPRGLIKKLKTSLERDTLQQACEDMYKALNDSPKKAEMALELLFHKDPKKLIVPQYIREGLEWLQTVLKTKDHDFIEPKDKEYANISE